MITEDQKKKYEEAAKEYVKGSEKIKQLAAKNGFMAGAEHAHPIAHSEGWNEALEAVTNQAMSLPFIFMYSEPEWQREKYKEELQKLRK